MSGEAQPVEDRVASEKLRYVVEAELPRPIAQEFARLRGAHGASAGPFAANLLGHVLRHAVVILASTHAVRGWPRALRTRFAEELKKPQSLGQQLGLALALAEGIDPAEAAHPAARLAARLLDRPTRVQLDAAVTLRNAVLKKGDVDAGDELKRAVLAIVRELLFLRELPIVEVLSTKERAGAHVMEVRFLVGTEETEAGRVESDLALAPGKVYLLDPIARAAIDLDPLYHVHDGALAWLARASNPPELETGDGKAIKLASKVGDVADLVEGRARKPLTARFLTIRGGTQDIARRQLRAGDVVDGRYHVVKLIGEGGMAHVYEVEDREDGCARALKVLPYEYIRDRTMVTRFRREAEETRALDHPNVMPTLRFGEDFGDNFLVMPLAEGWARPDGTRALDASQLALPLSIADAVAIGKQAAEALHYVHGKGVVHRDLKPRNLLLDADRAVRLSDFGVAGTAEAMTLTMTGLGVGTPEYMAPEQIEGAEPAPAADLYGLGASLYHLLTGSPPYAGKTPLAIMQAVATRPVPDPRKLVPAIPPPLGKLVRQLLAKDPADRPRSAMHVFRALCGEDAEPDAEEPAPEAWIELDDGRVAVSRASQLVLGNQPDCDVVVRSPQASRRHAMIRYADSRMSFMLLDLGSVNGTQVNGERVTQHALVDGDVISIGELRATFRLRSDPAATAQPGGPSIIHERYQLERELSRDSVGVLYEAEDLSLHRKLWIRVFNQEVAARPEAIRRFSKVVLSTSRLDDPSILRVLDVVASSSASYMVMERFEGINLHQLVERDGPLAPDRACSLARKVAGGLAAAHTGAVLHRDVKPSNILVGPRDAGFPVRIMDFGMDELLRSESDAAPTGMRLVGTPQFMAPELLDGGAVGPTIDVYGLGLVLYYALTGRLPIEGVSLIELLQRMREPVRPPSTLVPSIPPALDAVIVRALDREPGRRFATVQAFAEALDGNVDVAGASTADASSIPGTGTRLANGKYELEQLVASSPVSLFYDAVEVAGGRRLTIRLRHPSLADDLEGAATARRVAWSTASIKHPCVLQLYDVDTDPRWGLYGVMEPRGGSTLEDLVRAEGRLSLGRGLAIARQLARATTAAHAQHVFPADLTPSRLFVSDSGGVERVRIAEFGLHELELRDQPLDDRTNRVHTLGPGRVEGTTRPGPGDVYALGTVLHFMLTGAMPFTGATASDVLAAHDQQPLVPPSRAVPTIPRAVDAVVARALAKDPARRYASTRAFAAALEEVDRSTASRALRSWWALAGVLAALVCASAWWALAR